MLFLQFVIIDDIECYKGYLLDIWLFLDKKALKAIETILTLIPNETVVKLFHCENLGSGYYER